MLRINGKFFHVPGLMKHDTNPNKACHFSGKSLKITIDLHGLIPPPPDGSHLPSVQLTLRWLENPPNVDGKNPRKGSGMFQPANC